MGEDNVLSGGIEVLFTIKEYLLELDGYKHKTTELETEEDRLEQLILAKEKSISEEIQATVTARREEVGFSFDGQIEQTRVRLKKVKSKRDKHKNMKVSERIKQETSDLEKERLKLELEIKSVFKLNQIPRLFNNRFFFAVFMPGELTDFLIFILFALVSFLLPLGIYYFIPSVTRTIWQLVLIYVIVLCLIVLLFMLIYKKVKLNHEAALKDVRLVRNKLARNKKNIIKIKRRIAKDSDESSYGLEKYDGEITELEQQMTQIAEQKREAIEGFETKTKPNITNEIKTRYVNELEMLKQKHSIAYEEYRKSEEKVKHFVLEISKRYEAYLGKDFTSISMIDSLIHIIQNEDAKTVSEALNYYKNLVDQTQAGQK